MFCMHCYSLIVKPFYAILEIMLFKYLFDFNKFYLGQKSLYRTKTIF